MKKRIRLWICALCVCACGNWLSACMYDADSSSVNSSVESGTESSVSDETSVEDSSTLDSSDSDSVGGSSDDSVESSSDSDSEQEDSSTSLETSDESSLEDSTGDIQTYAYTITYDFGKLANDPYLQASATQTGANTGENVTLITPSCEGYRFVKWVLQDTDETVQSGTYAYSCDVTLVAQWQVNISSNRWIDENGRI